MSRPLYVEVVQKRQSRASKEHVKEVVNKFLSNFASLIPGATLSKRELEGDEEVAAHVEVITFCDVEHEHAVAAADVELNVVVHSLDERGAETDSVGGGGEECAAAEVWALPARAFHGLWESLVFDEPVKRDTVRLVESALEFGERGVDPLVVGWNRVVLLHGPPGTGKTSLCRALAHKLAVRFSGRFPRARLIEINAHGLFSKWFAESGKLVARLFERVHEMAADPRLLTCVLIDEVESLAHARTAALAGLEPSDALRAVNALLTQLDRLRHAPNALVLTTSNVTGAIDVAFADRADIKRRVGPPSARAAYRILCGCCDELSARGAVRATTGEALVGAEEASRAPLGSASAELWKACVAAAERGVSGRALRRLPLLAHALHAPCSPDLPTFVRALCAALQAHLHDDDTFRTGEPGSGPGSSAMLNGH